MAERLVQQWVHRRGLAALETLMVGPLLASQGAEAAQWLQERAGGAPLGVVVPAVQPESEWLSESVEQPVELDFEPVVAQRVEPGVELVVEQPVEQQVEPVVESIPAAAFSGSWPQLALVPDGEPAPAPRALAPLRAWLPDADSLPLAS
jgi:hypothetical protein